MLVSVRNYRFILPSLLLMPFFVSGCARTPAQSVQASRADAAQQQQEIEAARQQMELIPPPSKTRYMAVKSLASWENPYLTVQGGMVTLHVLLADANLSPLGQGGLLRPTGARRQDMNVRISELSTALNAIPQSAWPYGRVIAVEEAHGVPVSARPEVRRNLEGVIKTLSDLGIVAYEWTEAGRS